MTREPASSVPIDVSISRAVIRRLTLFSTVNYSTKWRRILYFHANMDNKITIASNSNRKLRLDSMKEIPSNVFFVHVKPTNEQLIMKCTLNFYNGLV